MQCLRTRFPDPAPFQRQRDRPGVVHRHPLPDGQSGKQIDRDPIAITITVGRASFAVALFKERAKSLFDDLGRRSGIHCPVDPVIEVGKVRSSQPEEG